MQNIAELAKKEKQMKAQIKELQKREKQYQEASKNVETLTTKCCDCGNSGGISAEIDKISRELRLENKVLKSELEGLKLELKHCLEKVEGPMKQQLQTEKMKCENLQKDLQSASKNMVISQVSVFTIQGATNLCVKLGSHVSGSLTVLSNCVSSSSNFDTVFLTECTEFGSVFLG